jgi:hypothetical protein
LSCHGRRDKSIQTTSLTVTRSRTGSSTSRICRSGRRREGGLVKGLDPAKFDASKYFLNDYSKAAAAKLK